MVQVFISYANSDRPWAERLAARIERQGWTPWWFQGDRRIPVGAQDWIATVDAALRGSQAFVVLWSAASVRSKEVAPEAHFAFKADRLICAFLEDVIIPYRYGLVQGVRLHKDADAGLEALVSGVAGLVGEASAPVPAARAKPAPSPTSAPIPWGAHPGGARRLVASFYRPVRVLDPNRVFAASPQALVRANPRSAFLRRLFHPRWLEARRQPIAFAGGDAPEDYARYAPKIAGFEPFAAFVDDVRLGAHRAPDDPAGAPALQRLLAPEAAAQLALSPLTPDQRLALLPVRPLRSAALWREQGAGELRCWLDLHVYPFGVGVLELVYERLALPAEASPFDALAALKPERGGRLRVGGEFWATPELWFTRLGERVDQAVSRAGRTEALAPLGPWRALASLDQGEGPVHAPPEEPALRLHRPRSDILIGPFGALEAFHGNQTRDVLWVQALQRAVSAREGLTAALDAEAAALAAPMQAGIVWRKGWPHGAWRAPARLRALAALSLKAASALHAIEADPRRPPFTRTLSNALRTGLGLAAAQSALADRLAAMGALLQATEREPALARRFATAAAILRLP